MNPNGSREAQARPAHPGDVGRRVAHRRGQLGLSREQVATKTGIAANYLEYLESRPDVIELETITKLAGALGTSIWHLLGGGLDLPPGQAPPAASPVLEELEPWQCWAKLAPGGVGRIALTTPDGPQVVPVNYHVLDGSVLYRTTVHSLPARAVGTKVAFEVDRLDEAFSSGWSVLVTGSAQAVTEPEAIEWLGKHADPKPWAGGPRDTWVRISPRRITGRQVHTVDLLPPEPAA